MREVLAVNHASYFSQSKRCTEKSLEGGKTTNKASKSQTILISLVTEYAKNQNNEEIKMKVDQVLHNKQ